MYLPRPLAARYTYQPEEVHTDLIIATSDALRHLAAGGLFPDEDLRPLGSV